MRELTEKQTEFLDAATSALEKRATDPGYQYWMTGEGQDESYSYCHECLFPEIGPRPESCSRGIGMEESDGVELCECCGVLLDYVLTEYGVTDELFHFADTPESLDWNNPDQCYEVSRVASGVDDPDKKRLLIGILLKGKNFPKELKRIRLKSEPVVMDMKIGTQPYWNMRVKYARKRPDVGAMVYVKQNGARYKWSKWMFVRIDKYNSDGYCFASYV